MPRTARCATALALTILFGVGFWFRASSLGSMPIPDGDEAWHGLQAARMAEGKSFAWQTPTRNPLNPFFTPLDIPSSLFCRPSWPVLRIPAVACGVLAVLLTYVLGAKVLDRTTATIAAGSLAVLPVAIIFSRIAFDTCQTPLATLIALYFAFRAHRGGLIASFLACILVHPTNVFLLPALLPIYLVQALRGEPGDPARRRRIVIEALVVPTTAALAFGLWIMRRPSAQASCSSFLKVHDWPEFATAYGRLMFAVGPFAPSQTVLRAHDVGFWAVVLPLLAFGLRPLIRARQWDRLALVVGLIASAVGFHVVTGKGTLQFAWVSCLRYGLFLVVPTCLALACLARGLLVEPADGPRALARGLQNFALLGLGFACLSSIESQWFSKFRPIGESIWTFKTDRMNEEQKALSIVIRDLARPGADRSVPATVIASDYWVRNPLKYLAHDRRDVRFLSYEDLIYQPVPYPEPERLRKLRERMEAGAYAVGINGKEFEALVRSLFPADRLKFWFGHVVVYRLKTPAELASDAAGAVASGPSATRR